MQVPSKILGGDGKPIMKDVVQRWMHARYDAAQTTPENKRHWAQADGLSANAANSVEVRYRLRTRARYEYDNNGYCSGLILTHANDLVGCGPTLQILTDDDATNTLIEEAFQDWSDAIGLAEKMHTLKQVKMRDGEAFALLIDNPEVDNPVQLDIASFEAELCCAVWGKPYTNNYVDGIQLDAARNPVSYDVLNYHPGDLFTMGLATEGQYYTTHPRKNVLHWFRCDRPAQARGVPEIRQALPLFAQLRRFILATLSSAEVAASFSAVLENNSVDADPDSQIEGNPFESMEIVRNMMTLLPRDHKLNQLKSENPATTFGMFKMEMLKEIGRCVNAPYNVVAGDSSPYNYSSAKLDRGLYQVALRVERDSMRRNMLERILPVWFTLAQANGVLPESLSLRGLKRAWYWPGTTVIEPLKEASANTENLANGTTSLAELAAEEGMDWQDRMRQRAKEQALAKELGLVSATVLPRGETPDVVPTDQPTPGAIADAMDLAGVSEQQAEAVFENLDIKRRQKQKQGTLPMKAQPATNGNGHAKPTSSMALRLAALEDVVAKKEPAFTFHLPAAAAPVVNNHTTVEAPAAPVLNTTIENHLPAPVNEVHVEQPEVTVENTVNLPAPVNEIKVGFQKRKGDKDEPPVQ